MTERDYFEQFRGDVTHLQERINEAVKIARHGSADVAHHKMWVIDQMVRVLLGEDYLQWRTDFEAGEDGPHTYEWEEGVAP